jgi:DNA-binding GntR family transcriptional regulator
MARKALQLPSLQASPGPATGERGAFTRAAYEVIRAAILDCTLLPGMALSEQALSAELGVSRAPVRDALRQLAAEGLVQVIAQKGTYVSRLDPARIRDAIFVREVIECRAAELAAAAPLPQRRALQALLAQQVAASARGDYASHLQADEDLHREILSLGGHPHAWAALRLARTGMNRIRHLAIATSGSHRIAIDHHQQIVSAIVAGKPALASERMREHIRSPLAFLDAIALKHPDYIEAQA